MGAELNKAIRAKTKAARFKVPPHRVQDYMFSAGLALSILKLRPEKFQKWTEQRGCTARVGLRMADICPLQRLLHKS